MSAKHKYFDRILGRIDELAPDNVAAFVQRLARERALFETIFNTIQEGILVVDRDGEIAYANAAAARLTGWKPDAQTPSPTLWKLVPGLYESLGRALETWGEDSPSAITRQVEICYPETRSLRLYVVPFGGDKPPEGRFAIILSDITQERRSTDARIESERVESIVRLAAGVAHEIGNPLNSINIHLQLLQRRLRALALDEKHRAPLESSLKVCADEVGRLDGIVRNFLGAVRPAEPDFTQTDVLALVQEVLSLLGVELKDRGLSVMVDAAESPPPVMADKAQLKQVFFNLVKNAMQAMERGGTLRISSRADDACVYLYFADTGHGISQENLARVFQPYFTTKAGGHGLGMMIVQRILRAHGAHIDIDSRPEKGTVVTLRFPRKDRKVRLLP